MTNPYADHQTDNTVSEYRENVSTESERILAEMAKPVKV